MQISGDETKGKRKDKDTDVEKEERRKEEKRRKRKKDRLISQLTKLETELDYYDGNLDLTDEDGLTYQNYEDYSPNTNVSIIQKCFFMLTFVTSNLVGAE